MKKTITALALGAILIPAAAVASSYDGHHGEHRAERMAEHLQLNEQQRGEIQQILDEQRDKRRAWREQMRAETQDRINKVLTPEQQAKWQQHREERMARMCDRHGKDGKGYHHEEHERGEGHHRGRYDD